MLHIMILNDPPLWLIFVNIPDSFWNDPHLNSKQYMSFSRSLVGDMSGPFWNELHLIGTWWLLCVTYSIIVIWVTHHLVWLCISGSVSISDPFPVFMFMHSLQKEKKKSRTYFVIMHNCCYKKNLLFIYSMLRQNAMLPLFTDSKTWVRENIYPQHKWSSGHFSPSLLVHLLVEIRSLIRRDIWQTCAHSIFSDNPFDWAPKWWLIFLL